MNLVERYCPYPPLVENQLYSIRNAEGRILEGRYAGTSLTGNHIFTNVSAYGGIIVVLSINRGIISERR